MLLNWVNPEYTQSMTVDNEKPKIVRPVLSRTERDVGSVGSSESSWIGEFLHPLWKHVVIICNVAVYQLVCLP